MGLPCSSYDTAAELIENESESPDFLTYSFIMYSAIGLLQIFPWQTKIILIILLSVNLLLIL